MTGTVELTPPRAEQALKPSPFQERVLAIPGSLDLALTGGRGGGKSMAAVFLIIQHVEQYGAMARMLYARQSFPGAQDFIALCRRVFSQLYGAAASYNSTTHLWQFPNGATLQIDQLEGERDWPKYQGKSFSLVIVDEAGEFVTPALLDRLRSSLRAPAPVQVQFVIVANPGGAGHAWVAQRHALREPWKPYEDGGHFWVTCPSTYLDNPFLNQGEYAAQLAAATRTDPELANAWLLGDWTIARGAFFAAVLDQRRNMVMPWPRGGSLTPDLYMGEFPPPKRRLPFRFTPVGRPAPKLWRSWLAHDYGYSAPSVTYLCAESPGDFGPDGVWYPRDSVVLLDEVATWDGKDPSKGTGMLVSELAAKIRRMCDGWGLRDLEGSADPAIFARGGLGAGSIANEFRAHGIEFWPAGTNDREAGWERMRQMLADAGRPDVPGLYVSAACRYFWATVPLLGRDPHDPDDVDTRAADHAADAARYGLFFAPKRMPVIEQTTYTRR